MTIVYGQIESLKRIKKTLHQKGITRFNSIGEINDFKRNFEFEKQNIYNQIEIKLEKEITDLQNEGVKLQEKLENFKVENINKLNDRIYKLNSKYERIKLKNPKYKVLRIWNLLLITIIKYAKNNLDKNFDKTIQKITYKVELEVNKNFEKINKRTVNKEKIFLERSLPEIRELTNIKEIINDLDPLIAGAIGENLVEKELKKLSDKNILFNDFSVKFKTPIYNRKENEKIFSIQIDHILITNSGIFILETKNWSKKSIESLDLRSPIEQIKRTSYALFVILNGDSKQEGVSLKKHHWGNKQIPIRNIIVMINQKPKEKFKFVQVKTLNELNRYVNYFEPIFDDSEVNRISEFLKLIMN
jgi:hypothetical protein